MIKQVKFRDCNYDGIEFGGIMLADGSVICGCCGGFYEPDDEEIEIIEEYKLWIDISKEIKGDA